jgi:hypothetical protein
VTFDDRPGQEQPLNGHYPANVIDWGSGQWHHAAPFAGFRSKSVSFTRGLTSASFKLVNPRHLARIDAMNGGSRPSTVSVSCANESTRSITLAAGQSATISTGWQTPCESVTIASSNGWDTNFDNLVFDAAQLDAPAATTVTFDDRPGANQPLNGQYPNGLIDWGSGRWFHSGPWAAFNSNSVSFIGGLTSAELRFVTPRQLVRLDAVNGGSSQSTLSLACAGQPTRSVTLAPNQRVTVETGWNAPCTSVIVSATNSWDTNLDNLVVQ